jgi:hypothetical protein
MSELNVNKKYILKVCQLLYSQFIANNKYYLSDLYHDFYTYETIFKHIQKTIGHKDADEVDFIYACFYENVNKWGDKILTISPEQIDLPKLKEMKGIRSYFATVRYDEYYSHKTYMPIMLEYMVEEYIINEDNVETDVIDTWDYTTRIEVGE